MSTATREAEELLQIEEADAWNEYVEATHGVPSSSPRYKETEPWAWARLSAVRKDIRSRRAKLQAA